MDKTVIIDIFKKLASTLLYAQYVKYRKKLC